MPPSLELPGAEQLLLPSLTCRIEGTLNLYSEAPVAQQPAAFTGEGNLRHTPIDDGGAHSASRCTLASRAR